MKTSEKVTVMEATAEAFEMAPDQFSANELIAAVRVFTERPDLRDGTITRTLRRLSAKNPDLYGYECTDSRKSIYLKNNQS